MKQKVIIALVIIILFLPIFKIKAFHNGDSEDVYYSVRFGSHDWIAHKAILSLPSENRTWYIGDAILYYLTGTEAPDNSSIDLGGGLVGYGDTPNHHNYYTPNYNDTLSNEDDASIRAQEEYNKAYIALQSGNLNSALFYAGAVTHYIADLAVWGHVMTNETNHSNFEDSVNNKMDHPDETFFTFSFDGMYDNHSAYESAFLMGQETAGNGSGIYNAIWMDNNYEAFGFKTEPETEFDFRVEYLINMAINLITDVLYSLFSNCQEEGEKPNICLIIGIFVGAIAGCITIIIFIIKYKK